MVNQERRDFVNILHEQSALMKSITRRADPVPSSSFGVDGITREVQSLSCLAASVSFPLEGLPSFNLSPLSRPTSISLGAVIISVYDTMDGGLGTDLRVQDD